MNLNVSSLSVLSNLEKEFISARKKPHKIETPLNVQAETWMSKQNERDGGVDGTLY